MEETLLAGGRAERGAAILAGGSETLTVETIRREQDGLRRMGGLGAFEEGERRAGGGKRDAADRQGGKPKSNAGFHG